MNNLTPVGYQELLDILLIFAFVGIIVFGISVLIMIFMFGMSTKNTLKNYRGLAVFFIASISIPAIAGIITVPVNPGAKALSIIQIYGLESTKINNNSHLISFNTSEPAIVYLNYRKDKEKEYKMVFPTYSMEKRTNHTFLIENTGSNKGEAVLVVNGQECLIEGKSIPINN